MAVTANTAGIVEEDIVIFTCQECLSDAICHLVVDGMNTEHVTPPDYCPYNSSYLPVWKKTG